MSALLQGSRPVSNTSRRLRPPALAAHRTNGGNPNYTDTEIRDVIVVPALTDSSEEPATDFDAEHESPGSAPAILVDRRRTATSPITLPEPKRRRLEETESSTVPDTHLGRVHYAKQQHTSIPALVLCFLRLR